MLAIKKVQGYSFINITVALGLFAVLIGSAYYLFKDKAPISITETALTEPEVVKETPIIEAITKVETQVRIPVKPTVILPLLDNSDPMALTSVLKLTPSQNQLLIKEEMIRNFVVFVDNLSRGQLMAKFSPLAKPNKPFTTINVDQKIYLDSESYNRYNNYAEIINSINIKVALKHYLLLEPLFDQAYHEIGYPDQAFANRLNEAIDILEETPIIREPIALLSPSVMYKFADPQLEKLPSAQKLLLRMGPDNTLKIKAKLLLIQQALQQMLHD